jgi:hypothetical protein
MTNLEELKAEADTARDVCNAAHIAWKNAHADAATAALSDAAYASYATFADAQASSAAYNTARTAAEAYSEAAAYAGYAAEVYQITKLN